MIILQTKLLMGKMTKNEFSGLYFKYKLHCPKHTLFNLRTQRTQSVSIVDLNFIGIGPKKCFTCVFTVFTDICPKKIFEP